MKRLLFLALLPIATPAQEASSGFDLRMTLSGDADKSNTASGHAGYRAILYPTWKLNSNWSVTGAYQVNSANFFIGSAPATDYKAKGFLLQASLNYSLVRKDKSLMLRAGELSSAFGSFLLRYDDAQNPLIALPVPYGYYYAAVSTLAVAGMQADVTWGKWDGRAQFANSSPSNPRAITSRDQYGNWAGGGGYSIRQGLRIGASAYYGPFTDRHSPFYFPGEDPPARLLARAVGIDAQWASGHWNVQGEWQKFNFPYVAIPVFREQAGYFEVKRVLHPRWYVASRFNELTASVGGAQQIVEGVAGFRPANNTLLKFGYQWQHYSEGTVRDTSVVLVQLVATVHPLAIAFH